MINDCVLAPCQNGCTCIDQVHTHLCHCAPGYTELMCQTGKHPKWVLISCIFLCLSKCIHVFQKCTYYYKIFLWLNVLWSWWYKDTRLSVCLFECMSVCMCVCICLSAPVCKFTHLSAYETCYANVTEHWKTRLMSQKLKLRYISYEVWIFFIKPPK